MITPLEIRKLEFNKKMSGYDTVEVRSALESIAREMETLTRENTSKGEELLVLQEKLSHFRLIEKTLQDSVLTMQTTLEEKRRTAEHEAQLIIHEARQRAHEELSEFTDRIRRLRDEIEYLENQKKQHFIRFKHFCLSQLDWLNSMEANDDTLSPRGQTSPHSPGAYGGTYGGTINQGAGAGMSHSISGNGTTHASTGNPGMAAQAPSSPNMPNQVLGHAGLAHSATGNGMMQQGMGNSGLTSQGLSSSSMGQQGGAGSLANPANPSSTNSTGSFRTTP